MVRICFQGILEWQLYFFSGSDIKLEALTPMS